MVVGCLLGQGSISVCTSSVKEMVSADVCSQASTSADGRTRRCMWAGGLVHGTRMCTPKDAKRLCVCVCSLSIFS